jgi:hypothetical protein
VKPSIAGLIIAVNDTADTRRLRENCSSVRKDFNPPDAQRTASSLKSRCGANRVVSGRNLRRRSAGGLTVGQVSPVLHRQLQLQVTRFLPVVCPWDRRAPRTAPRRSLHARRFAAPRVSDALVTVHLLKLAAFLAAGDVATAASAADLFAASDALVQRIGARSASSV